MGGCGLGFRERPGLGSSNSSSTAEVVKKCGPGSDRLSTMKAAFKSQYMTQVFKILSKLFKNKKI